MPKQRALDWKEVASWFDAEGYSRIVTDYGRHTGAKVGTTQNEAEPLVEIARFLGKAESRESFADAPAPTTSEFSARIPLVPS